jgi:hypothetical protein
MTVDLPLLNSFKNTITIIQVTYMLKNRAISILLLIIFVVISYVVLIKYVTPLIVDTTNSDLFIVDTGDYRVEGPSNTDMTEIASSFCFDELSTQYDEMNDINPSTIKHTAWALGGYQYVVNASIPASQSSDNKARTMVCKINYDYSSETPNSTDSWTIIGFSYETSENITQ